MSYPELPYTIEEFCAWLKSLQNPYAVAGYAGLPRSCPAAQWLCHLLQVDNARVDYDFVWIDGDCYDTPDWLSDFEDAVDNSPRGTSIGRRQALNLLTRTTR